MSRLIIEIAIDTAKPMTKDFQSEVGIFLTCLPVKTHDNSVLKFTLFGIVRNQQVNIEQIACATFAPPLWRVCHFSLPHHERYRLVSAACSLTVAHAHTHNLSKPSLCCLFKYSITNSKSRPLLSTAAHIFEASVSPLVQLQVHLPGHSAASPPLQPTQLLKPSYKTGNRRQDADQVRAIWGWVEGGGDNMADGRTKLTRVTEYEHSPARRSSSTSNPTTRYIFILLYRALQPRGCRYSPLSATIPIRLFRARINHHQPQTYRRGERLASRAYIY
jgi:hypothetical protein